MKKIFQKKYLTMVCFLVFLSVMCLQGLFPVYRGVKRMALMYLNGLQADVSVIETVYAEEFGGKYGFITANGAFQKLLGARVVNDRYRLDNGHLTYTLDKVDVTSCSSNTVAFRDALAERNIPFYHVNCPSKLLETDKQLPVGVEDYSNENSDKFLEPLIENQVPVLDLRDSIAEDGLEHYELFFRTDHHWIAEMGLWAAEKITDFLGQQDPAFAVDKSLWDSSNYNFDVYEDVFLGSAGIRVGEIYAGLDDITIITPKFDTHFTYAVESEGVSREGSFADTFLFMENLMTDDMLQSNSYATYCNSYHDFSDIHNFGTGIAGAANPRKILLICDSYSNVLIPFLSLAYEQVHVVDLRKYEKNLMEHVIEWEPDAVLMVYNPGAYGNTPMFDFYKQ